MRPALARDIRSARLPLGRIGPALAGLARATGLTGLTGLAGLAGLARVAGRGLGPARTWLLGEEQPGQAVQLTRWLALPWLLGFSRRLARSVLRRLLILVGRQVGSLSKRRRCEAAASIPPLPADSPGQPA